MCFKISCIKQVDYSLLHCDRLKLKPEILGVNNPNGYSNSYKFFLGVKKTNNNWLIWSSHARSSTVQEVTSLD